jgi:hypothetical protein
MLTIASISKLHWELVPHRGEGLRVGIGYILILGLWTGGRVISANPAPAGFGAHWLVLNLYVLASQHAFFPVQTQT